MTAKKMPTSAKYVLDIPKSSLEKHGSEVHSAENLHSINGQTSNVMVVPHNNRLTIAWDCCILQYCLMAHFLKNEFASGLSVMVLRLAPSLKKQSPKKTSGWIKRDYFGRIVWTKETWSGKDEPYTAWRLIYDFGEVHEILDWSRIYGIFRSTFCYDDVFYPNWRLESTNLMNAWSWQNNCEGVDWATYPLHPLMVSELRRTALGHLLSRAGRDVCRSRPQSRSSSCEVSRPPICNLAERSNRTDYNYRGK